MLRGIWLDFVPQLEGTVLLNHLLVPNVVDEERREDQRHIEADRADLNDYEWARAELMHHR